MAHERHQQCGPWGTGTAPGLTQTGQEAEALATWGRMAPRFGGAKFKRVEVNGQPGAVALDADDRVISVMALDIAEGRVQGVRSIVNPDKLRHVGPVADLRALLERASRTRRTTS